VEEDGAGDVGHALDVADFGAVGAEGVQDLAKGFGYCLDLFEEFVEVGEGAR